MVIVTILAVFMQLSVVAEVTRLDHGESFQTASLPRLLHVFANSDCMDAAKRGIKPLLRFQSRQPIGVFMFVDMIVTVCDG
jgi:hypothetical protein